MGQAGGTRGRSRSAFFVAVPYSILDFETFRADVLYEIRHYRDGHPGHDVEPGLLQLSFYLGRLVDDFGVAICLMCLGGATALSIREPRRALVLLSFPVLMLLHMSTNRTHFVRSILPVFALVPVFATVGIDEAARLLARVLRKIGRLNRYDKQLPSWAAALTLLLATAGAAASVDGTRLFDMNVRRECRDLAIRFVDQYAKQDQTVVVADDLWMNPKDLADRRVVTLSPGLGDWKQGSASLTKPALILLPEYGTPQSVPPHLREGKKRRTYLERAKRNTQRAKKNVRRLVESSGAELLETIDGKPTSLGEHSSQRAVPIANPTIRIYETRADPRK